MQARFLAVDIGNTHTVIGLFEGLNLQGIWRITSRTHITTDELWTLLAGLFALQKIPFNKIKDVVISCVVPTLLDPWEGVCSRYLGGKAIIINATTPTGLKILYKRPYELGADRIVNAIAAYEHCKGATIVVDFGTATTFDCISEYGEYLGGAIAPGIHLSAEALFHGTSKLPRVKIQGQPSQAIAQDTSSAIKVGLLYGFAGLADRIVQELSKEFAVKPAVLATGGLADVIAPHSHTIQKVIPELTLEGIALVYSRLKAAKLECL